MSEETNVFEVIVRTKPAQAGRSLTENSKPKILLGPEVIQCRSAEDAKIEAVRRVDRSVPYDPAKPDDGRAWKLDELEVLVRPFCR